jgi:hypothetical protein
MNAESADLCNDMYDNLSKFLLHLIEVHRINLELLIVNGAFRSGKMEVV